MSFQKRIMHDKKQRCEWVSNDPIYIHYHDHEWGVPIYDDRLLFEFLILEGAQAGLNWLTILKRRENYKLAFDNFNTEKIACYNKNKYNELYFNYNNNFYYFTIKFDYLYFS